MNIPVKYRSGLSSNAKLLVVDTCLFSVTHGISTSTKELNNDLAKINNWAFQWKMYINPDPSLTGLSCLQSKDKENKSCTIIFYNKIYFFQSSSQKHLGIILGEQLIFCKHLKMLTSRINKTIGLLCKLQKHLPSSALIIIHLTFLRLYLDHDDIMFLQCIFPPQNLIVLINASLAITGDIRGTSKEELYQEIGLESLQLQCRFRKCSLHKIYKNNQLIFPIQFHNEILLLKLKNLG